MFVCPAILNLQIFPFDVSRLFEAPPNGGDEGGICTGRNAAQETDDPAGPVWLRTHGKGKKDRPAGNKCEQVAPLHFKVLVQPDETAVAGYIGRQDRGQLALDGLLWHLAPPP
jgi:hypothetical protein